LGAERATGGASIPARRRIESYDFAVLGGVESVLFWPVLLSPRWHVSRREE